MDFKVLHYFPWGKGFACRPRRAGILTATAVGASVQVKELLPGEILNVPNTKGLSVFNVNGGRGSYWSQGAEKDIQRRYDDML